MVDTAKDPDYINAEGTKWWFEPALTDYARKKGLVHFKVWFVEKNDGETSFIIINQSKKDPEPVYANESRESTAAYIHFVSLIAKRKREEIDKKKPYHKTSMAGAHRAFRGS